MKENLNSPPRGYYVVHYTTSVCAVCVPKTVFFYKENERERERMREREREREREKERAEERAEERRKESSKSSR